MVAAHKRSNSRVPATLESPEPEVIEEATPEPEIPPEKKPRPVLPIDVPGTLTESGAYVPSGHMELVDCDMFPGLDLKVVFNTSVAFRILSADYEGYGETPVEKECRRLSSFVRDFMGWNFQDPVTGQPIPKPIVTEWQSFQCIVTKAGAVAELYPWLIGPGLIKAMDQSMGNSASS